MDSFSTLELPTISVAQDGSFDCDFVAGEPPSPNFTSTSSSSSADEYELPVDYERRDTAGSIDYTLYINYALSVSLAVFIRAFSTHILSPSSLEQRGRRASFSFGFLLYARGYLAYPFLPHSFKA
ncbi:hypothetical protein K435DRAFT_963826 [Dendrothele bispora CBS 962.96]|uniref:Uncharacterized protein n=1 Tax=Dendrothele bispora (strain CBS 962.96) TaxID=1314807 RepID=A0A4V4HH05_DENBC|nr:hypothetical protein K435DRAFT_963826 [Dendrothele bispora CBS 962.96]